jgi:pimeloyl-ACP methyl ester carboxylesterase
LVGLHGGPGLDHHLLLCLGRRLARRWDVLLPDLPGHGASRAPSGKLPGLTALVERTESWLRHLSPPGPPVLLGHSLGAWLVLELLRRGRFPVAGAVVLAPPAAGRSRGETALARAGALVPVRADDAAREDLERHLVEETAERRVPPELAADLETARLVDPRSYGALLRNLWRRLTGPVRGFDPNCPVLVVAGGEDRTTPPAEVAQVASSLAGARFELVEGAGHYLHAERPESVAELVMEFLAPILDRRPPSAGRLDAVQA